MNPISQSEKAISTFRRIGQGFCGSVWAAEEGEIAMKREDGGPGRSILIDYTMHKHVLEKASHEKEKLQVCVPQWPRLIKYDDPWWHVNLARFPQGYTACNMLCSERIPPLPQDVRDRLVDRYCPAESIATIKSNDPDRDCLVRLYLGRRKIQNHARRGRNFFSLRNYPLHLNQAEELGLPIPVYARAMAEMLALMHWTAKIDANDVEFVLGGVQKDTGIEEHTHEFMGHHCLWVLDFDCCKPLVMDGTGVEQAACAFLRNDPYFPRPAIEGTSDHALWLEFRNHYLDSSQVSLHHLELPKRFITRVEELHRQAMDRRR